MQSSLYTYTRSTYIRYLILTLMLVMSTSAAAGGKFNVQKRYLYVQPGQTVYTIVRVLYPDQKQHWREIIKNIVKKNPHAFIGADATRIQVGARIELPPASYVQRTAGTARAMVYHEPKAVGKVISSRGKTFVITSNDKTRNINMGSEVFVGDRVFTGVKGFVRLHMIDDAKIDLRCNSEMLIEDYQLQDGGNRSVLHLIKGSVNKVTGTIGKMAEDIYEMRTPVATVGVRGTEYAIRVLQSHGCDGSLDVNSRGMFVKVNSGSIEVKTQKQKLTLNRGQTIHIADTTSKATPITTRPGVFTPVVEEEKGYFFGSMTWLVLLIPAIMRLRRYGHRD